MALQTIVALLVFVSFNNFHSVLSLDCYSCTASLGSNYKCENLSYSNGALPYYTCIYGDAVCAKYVIQYEDTTMMHRSCQHKDICSVLASRYNNHISRLLDCQTCSDHHYCNTGKNVTSFGALVLLGFIFCCNLVYRFVNYEYCTV